MRKKIILLLFLATLFLFRNEPVNAKPFDFQPIEDSMKPWTITFNDDVSKQANLKSIIITSSNKTNHDVSITISDDSKKVIVKPLNPYQIGVDYTLIVPEGFESAKGAKLNKDFTKPFKLQGTHIESVSANWNGLATNVIVQGTKNVAEVKVFLEGGRIITLNQLGYKFSRGIIGLLPGDALTIRAYDEQNNLLETQYYEVK